MLMDNINDIHNSKTYNSQIKFNIEQNFKELPFLDSLLKTKMAKLSQIFTTDPQTLNIMSIL